MRVAMSTNLDTSAERAWTEVQTSRLLNHVAWPLLSFEPINPPTFPAMWQEGRYLVRMRAFGVISIGQQWIVITKPMLGPDRYQLRDDGHGNLFSRWDHVITVEPLGAGRCCYTDEVEVEAGLLTPIMRLFVYVFYAHRQRRWRRLVRNHFSYRSR